VTDQEVICEWMEPKPTERPGVHGANELWWRWGWRYVGPSLPQQQTPVEYCWLPRKLTLDALWEVEERLTKMGGWWDTYVWKLTDSILDDQPPSVIHASAGRKTAAIAAVLRPLVEKPEPGERR
jgi:hypothetical protein